MTLGNIMNITREDLTMLTIMFIAFTLLVAGAITLVVKIGRFDVRVRDIFIGAFGTGVVWFLLLLFFLT